MDYDTIRKSYCESIKLRSNECYVTVASKEKDSFTVDDNKLLDSSDTPYQGATELFRNGNRTIRSTKKRRIAIILMVFLYSAVLIIAAVSATTFAKSLSTKSQLNTIEKAMNAMQDKLRQYLEESNNADKSNKEKVDILQEMLNETSMNQTWQFNYLKNYVDVVAEAVASSSTQNLSANLVSQLIHSLKTNHVFHSCAAIAALSLPFPTGMYWIEISNGSSAQVYCYFNRTLTCNGMAGGWRRIANLDTRVTGNNTKCPPNFKLLQDPLSCQTLTVGQNCASVSYPVGSLYSCVYGRILALQSGSPDGFAAPDAYTRTGSPTLEGNYVDGVSLTYGRNPRHHIRTFAAGLIYNNNKCTRCERNRPQFIGDDYSCEINELCPTGSVYCNGPLWDNDQCIGQETFHRQLEAPTTDDIEMRVCRDQENGDEDFLITTVELYVH